MTGKLQKLGTTILVKFLKKHPTAAEDALKILKDKFASESSNIKCIAGENGFNMYILLINIQIAGE